MVDYFKKNGIPSIKKEGSFAIDVDKNPMYVGSVLHKAVIEMNEGGTEASAITRNL